MSREEINKMYGFWGKFHTFDDDSESRMIWLGPMSGAEMLEHFCEFRHNFRKDMSELSPLTVATMQDTPEVEPTPEFCHCGNKANQEKGSCLCGDCEVEFRKWKAAGMPSSN